METNEKTLEHSNKKHIPKGAFSSNEQKNLAHSYDVARISCIGNGLQRRSSNANARQFRNERIHIHRRYQHVGACTCRTIE